MKYLKLFEDFDDPYSVDELISLSPKQLGMLLLDWHILRKPEVVKNILRVGPDLDVRERAGITPLHLAVYGKLTEVVELLIEAGADVNAGKSLSLEATPLHVAANYSTKEIMQILIGHGANVDAPDKYGRTPLHYTTFDSRWLEIKVESAKTLIELGASKNAKDFRDQTPWDMAPDNMREALPELNPNR